MKKITAILLCLVLLLTGALSACSKGEETAGTTTEAATGATTEITTEAATEATTEVSTEEVTTEAPVEPLKMDISEYPRVDGSTANIPLMALVLSEVCDIPLGEAQNLITVRKTSGAWMALTYGENDLLMVYEAAKETWDYVKDSGVTVEQAPLGTDALVFMVNEDNPVENLTSEQIRDIYAGKITNWKEVGGKDEAIMAFQRNSTSGSQSLMKKLIMGDTPMSEGPKELVVGEMGELISSLAAYNNAGNAIGYSVYYYANYMYTEPGLRFVAIDGVLPSDETIADGTYPLLNPFYVVIRGDEAADSNARKLFDYLQTDAGRALVEKAGYIPPMKTE